MQGTFSGSGSERNIVIKIHWRFIALRRCCCRLLCRARVAAAAELLGLLWLLWLTPAAALRHIVATAAAAAQHLHAAADIHHDFRGVTLLAALILPFAGLE